MKNNQIVWNVGRAVGERAPFSRAQVLTMAKRFRASKRWHDWALLATDVDTMLRSCDLLRLRVLDVSTGKGDVRTSFLWRQKKTRRNTRMALSQEARKALKRWIAESGKQSADYLFTREKGRTAEPISYSTYRRMVKTWLMEIGDDPADFSTHSIRR